MANKKTQTKKTEVKKTEEQSTKTATQPGMKREENGNIVLTIAIPSANIKKVYEEEIGNAVKNATLPGFRPGTAPRAMVEPKLDKEKLKEEALKKLLPEFYLKAIDENKLKPVISPRIHIEKLDDPEMGNNWTFEATTCEGPDVNLGNYKDDIKKLTAKSKIIVPGKEQPKPSLDEILAILVKSVKVLMPQIILDAETERLLSQLLNEIKRLGLTLDQYLGSSKKTIEELKKDYEEKAKADLTIEFALAKIADTEKIEVAPEELNEALTKAQSPAEKEQLQKNMYLLASVLRQQKTLDFLKNL